MIKLRDDLWDILRERQIDDQLIKCIKSLYNKTRSYIRIRNEKSESFTSSDGLKQGCSLSPIVFNLMLDEAIKRCKGEKRNIEWDFGKCERLISQNYVTQMI